LSNQREDLDKAILRFTETILFPPHSWVGHGPLIISALLFLAGALLKRSAVFKEPEDAIYAAKYLRHLRNQPHHVFGIPRHEVTAMLVDALASQVISEAGNAMHHITEISALCHELFTSDESDGDMTTRSIIFLSAAVRSKFRVWDPDLPLDQVIECLQLARMRKPELRVAHTVLALCLTSRYYTTLVNDDYEAAASILDEVTPPSSPRDGDDVYVAVLQHLVTLMAVIRSQAHSSPEYSEEAIYRVRAYQVLHPFDTSFKHFLELVASQRFRYFGSIEGHDTSPSAPISSQREPGWSENNNSEVCQRKELLQGLFSGIPNDDVAKMDEALEKGRAILASSPQRHMHSSYLFESFACILFEAYRRTNNIEYLNESIGTLRQAFERPILQFLRFTTLRYLAMALLTRWEYFPTYCTRDMDEGLGLFSQCVNDGCATLTDRFKVAFIWTFYARRVQHSTISTAYESAISLMQDALLFAPTLQLQHVTLSEMADVTHRMPQDYASYQIIQGQVEQAIETLEKGRALLWAEMRHLRTSIDHLLQADPQLGEKFAAINQDLEELTKSIPPSHRLSIDNSPADDLRAVDPFGRLLLKQRGLLKERDDLISQVQALPGFGSFLASPSFDILRTAALSGPVIVINHSSWRSDILILLHDAPPSLIPTPADFFVRSRALNNELLDARNKHGPDSDQYNETLAHVLAELYDLVGKPVIDRLRQLNVPEQSRVWWCPTSVFCSLPLHAMGPIPSDDGREDRYFLDIYIPSYTPTLSALIPASDNLNSGQSSLSPPSLLLVAHFDVPSLDVSLSEVCEDVKVVEQLNARLAVKSLISEGATSTSVLDGLRDHQFVHFVCHGTLEAKKPFDAGFELHSNERLTLLNIVQSRLPAAEFAFLSACHTAELTEGSSAEEGLHLAAAVQYCGFRSVVGTMWAMANQDGPELAKHFYKTMFPKKEKGEPEPYYKRSAGALRDAVKKLRKKRGMTLERWVNFVHYGA
jgi:CHAT domain-containing protein